MVIHAQKQHEVQRNAKGKQRKRYVKHIHFVFSAYAFKQLTMEFYLLIGYVLEIDSNPTVELSACKIVRNGVLLPCNVGHPVI